MLRILSQFYCIELSGSGVIFVALLNRPTRDELHILLTNNITMELPMYLTIVLSPLLAPPYLRHDKVDHLFNSQD